MTLMLKFQSNSTRLFLYDPKAFLKLQYMVQKFWNNIFEQK